MDGLFIAQEESTIKNPVDLFKIWKGEDYWYYTSADQSIDYNGNTYVPAPISRSSISQNNTMETTECLIQIGLNISDSIDELIKYPFDPEWITVYRAFRDQSPVLVKSLFTGQITSTSPISGGFQCRCESIESLLHIPASKFRVQAICNHILYDTKCGINCDAESGGTYLYRTDAIITYVSHDGLLITAGEFASFEDDFFKFGEIVYGSHRRQIVSHAEGVIQLRTAIPTLAIDSSVTVYAGCDGKPETCRDKFNNINNCLAFPYIGYDNPVLRMP